MARREPPNKPKSSYDPKSRAENARPFTSPRIMESYVPDSFAISPASLEQLRREISAASYGKAWADLSPDAGKSGMPYSLAQAREPVAKYIIEVTQDVGWGDIVGNDAARQALMDAIEEPRRNPELYAYYGMKPPKGVLMYGPPGCGKTMFAKAAGAAMSRIYGKKAEIVLLNGASLQSGYVAKTEERIRRIFKYARAYYAFHKIPLTIFVDEAEVLFPDRTGKGRHVHSWEESRVAQFLTEMDGMELSGAFVVLATNRPEAIDEALLRDGRCDRKIKVERPDRDAVEHIIRKSFKGAPLGDNIDMLVMAGTESFFNPHYVLTANQIIFARLGVGGEPQIKSTATNFCLEHIVSGAMAAGLINRAKRLAFARDKASGKREGIKVQDVVDAVKQVFEENKGLEHSFAMREYIQGLNLPAMAEDKGTLQ